MHFVVHSINDMSIGRETIDGNRSFRVISLENWLEEMQVLGAAVFGRPTETRDDTEATEDTQIIEEGSDDGDFSSSSYSDARHQNTDHNEEGSIAPGTNSENPSDVETTRSANLVDFTSNSVTGNLPRPAAQRPGAFLPELPSYQHGWGAASQEIHTRYFRMAQKQRHARATVHILGILGIFGNLADARADYVWAKDSAYRQIQGIPCNPWTDYEKARQKEQYGAFFTYFMLVINCQLVLLSFYWNQWQIESLAVNPFLGPKPSTLVELGALQTEKVLEDSEWERLVFSTTVHAGILHLAVNIVVFAVLCRSIENIYGTIPTAAFFMVSAVGGNIISVLMQQPGGTVVGPSGGIFGLVGVCIADAIQDRELFNVVFWSTAGQPSKWGTIICSIVWFFSDILLHVSMGFTPLVDNFASLSGLVYGFLFSWSLVQRSTLGSSENQNRFGNLIRFRPCAPRALGAVLGIFMLSWTCSMLHKSDGTETLCHVCRYVSCVPFPFGADEKWWYCDGCDFASGEVLRNDRQNPSLPTAVLIDCPYSGDTAAVDLSDDPARSFSVAQDEFSRYCREYC